MAIREGRWDCQYCGALGNQGRDKSCANCGRSRPDGTKFYLADDAEVSDKKLLQQAQLGPDWICEYCGTSNAANITVCGSCGAPREGTSPQQELKEFDVGEAPTSGDMTLSSEPTESLTAKTAKSAKRAIPILGVVGGLLLLCVLAIVAFAIFGGKDVEAAVGGFEWERTLEVEAFQTVTEEDWSVPTGGRVLSQIEEIHHTDKVLDHYETLQREVAEEVQVGERSYVCGQRDMGNGFFEDIECIEPVYETQYHTETYEEAVYRDEPVYQTLFTFEIDKWVVIRTEQADGNDHAPHWPGANLQSEERDGSRSDNYTIVFTDSEGETFVWEDVPLTEWQSYERGQGVKLKLNAFGDVSEVER